MLTSFCHSSHFSITYTAWIVDQLMEVTLVASHFWVSGSSVVRLQTPSLGLTVALFPYDWSRLNTLLFWKSGCCRPFSNLVEGDQVPKLLRQFCEASELNLSLSSLAFLMKRPPAHISTHQHLHPNDDNPTFSVTPAWSQYICNAVATIQMSKGKTLYSESVQHSRRFWSNGGLSQSANVRQDVTQCC